jgi:hypothetical protein
MSPSRILAGAMQPVRLAYQLPANNTFLSEQTSHYQPVSSTFLSVSISNQLPAKRTGRCTVVVQLTSQRVGRSASGRRDTHLDVDWCSAVAASRSRSRGKALDCLQQTPSSPSPKTYERRREKETSLKKWDSSNLLHPHPQSIGQLAPATARSGDALPGYRISCRHGGPTEERSEQRRGPKPAPASPTAISSSAVFSIPAACATHSREQKLGVGSI